MGMRIHKKLLENGRKDNPYDENVKKWIQYDKSEINEENKESVRSTQGDQDRKNEREGKRVECE